MHVTLKEADHIPGRNGLPAGNDELLDELSRVTGGRSLSGAVGELESAGRRLDIAVDSQRAGDIAACYFEE